MSKRKLDSKYTRLVDYINSNKDSEYLFQLLSRLKSRDTVESIIPDELNDGYATDYDFDVLISTIVDIYNDNYELDEPKHAYRLNDIDAVDGAIYVTLVRGFYYLSTYYAPNNNPTQELTDEQFQIFLSRFTKFTADMFEALEV